ncbi:hypothetical protein K8R66_04405 [bacterium]|nr:hypothetical protein [bacterium]
MNIKKIIFSSIVIWIVSLIFGWLTCGWLFNWVYELHPNIWVSDAQIMSTNSMIATSLIGLVTAFLFVLVYAIFYKGIPGKGVIKGINYGILIWMVGAFSGMITMPFYMIIANEVIVYWIIQVLVFGLIKGLIIGAMYKEKL